MHNRISAATIFALAACFILCFQTLGLAAEQTSLDAHLQRLAEQTGSVKSIKSDFKQTKYISFMDETLVSEGFLVFKAPAELEWQYTKPVVSGLLYQDGKATMWSAPAGTSPEQARKQASSGGSGAEESIGRIIAEQLITWTRLDIDKLKQSYNISLLEDSPLTIRLTPKQLATNNPIRDFKLVFEPNGVDVRQITLFEADDDYTQIDFLNFERQ